MYMCMQSHLTSCFHNEVLYSFPSKSHQASKEPKAYNASQFFFRVPHAIREKWMAQCTYMSCLKCQEIPCAVFVGKAPLVALAPCNMFYSFDLCILFLAVLFGTPINSVSTCITTKFIWLDFFVSTVLLTVSACTNSLLLNQVTICCWLRRLCCTFPNSASYTFPSTINFQAWFLHSTFPCTSVFSEASCILYILDQQITCLQCSMMIVWHGQSETFPSSILCRLR